MAEQQQQWQSIYVVGGEVPNANHVGAPMEPLMGQATGAAAAGGSQGWTAFMWIVAIVIAGAAIAGVVTGSLALSKEPGIQSDINALEAGQSAAASAASSTQTQVDAASANIATLQAQASAATSNINTLQGQIAALQTDEGDAVRAVTCVVATPSGAPPTNDGFAYSQFCYDNDTLWIAGQNGYDSCGNLVDPDTYGNGTYSIWTRAYIAFLNIKDIMLCMNMNMSHIPMHVVVMSDLLYRNITDSERNDRFLDWRSQINTLQRLPEFWGTDGTVPAREIQSSDWLSRGDTIEIMPLVIRRINRTLPTCDVTGVPTAAANALLSWTVNGTLPTTAVPLQALGTGACVSK